MRDAAFDLLREVVRKIGPNDKSIKDVLDKLDARKRKRLDEAADTTEPPAKAARPATANVASVRTQAHAEAEQPPDVGTSSSLGKAERVGSRSRSVTRPQTASAGPRSKSMAAAGANGKGKGPKKEVDDDDEDAAPLGEAERDAIVAQLLPAESQALLSSAKWQERARAYDELSAALEVSECTIGLAEATVILEVIAPGWKESNFNVTTKLFKFASLLVKKVWPTVPAEMSRFVFCMAVRVSGCSDPTQSRSGHAGIIAGQAF